VAKIAVTGFARRPACFTSVSDESGPRLIVVGTTTLRDGNERSGTLIAVFLTAESWAAFEPLKTLLLELAQERSLEALLPLVVSRLVEREDVALARVWMLAPGDICGTCPNRAVCEDRTQCLHLAASAARPLGGVPVLHSNLLGSFRRIPIGAFKVGTVAKTGATVVVSDPAHDPNIKRPEWVASERILAFAGQPLVTRGELLGVLGVFLRVSITPAGLDILHILANHLAAAMSTARAFDQIETMRRRLQVENRYLREAVKEDRVSGLVAVSAAMQDTLRDVASVAPTDTTALVLGESGTGKELIARAIHRHSARRDRPFIAVNCAAIPRELYESEFFGHSKGSFSGATRDQMGRFEAANGGTLFLDEIGEMPLELQGKLLRVLQEGTYERVGETRSRSADVRIIAATNRNLMREIELGRFRQDLYYRLNVFSIYVGPLRDRKEDLPGLVDHLLEDIARRANRPVPRLDAAHYETLRAYDWPGNVRELRNVLERAVIASGAGGFRLVMPESAAAPLSAPRSSSERPPPIAADVRNEEELRREERDNLLRALERTNGKIYGADGAAAVLGLKPTTLASRLRKLNIGAGRVRGAAKS
jgi:transcriptional regulator with GAF, ATPase, and Fis domain